MNFLRTLNKSLLFSYAELKEEFEKAPPLNNEIKKKFIVRTDLSKDWKGKFDKIVLESLQKYQEIDERTINFKELLAWMTA